MMYLAGFDVKDVHMTDLIAGRETLEEVNFIVFVGGFSNSDVLGSAKGWAGAFLYNQKAKLALDRFYSRDDTLSLGVCNGCQLIAGAYTPEAWRYRLHRGYKESETAMAVGCQLMVELGLVYPGHENKPKMQHNDSGKFESSFLGVKIPENNSILLKSLAGSELGIWVAHGEGKFFLPCTEDKYQIPMKYSHGQYPANPNGSDYNAAAIVSTDGRHLAMMPHLERAFYPWQWGYYPQGRDMDEISPWMEAFVNAREWVKANKKS